MSIVFKDGYFQKRDLVHVTALGIQTHRLEACIDRIKTNRIKGVFGCPYYDFEGTDLDFLTELPWVEDVWFWDINLTNIDGLYALPNLKHFGVHPKRPPIDFSRFPRLRTAVIEPKARDCGIETLEELESLHVWHYRQKDKTFSALALPKSLTELQINWANSTSLESLPALAELRRLEIHQCRNLVNLGNLGEKYPNLEYLVVSACGHVPRSEGERVVQNLHKLSHAYVQSAKLV